MTKLDIMREVTREIAESTPKDAGAIPMMLTCYALLVEARWRIHELETRYERVVMPNDEDEPEFPAVPDGWERFYTLEEYRGEGYRAATNGGEWDTQTLKETPLMLSNLCYIQPAAKPEPTLPGWCPPIPDGWEVCTEKTYRGGVYRIMEDGEVCPESFDPSLVGEPWWLEGAVYIQPKEQA